MIANNSQSLPEICTVTDDKGDSGLLLGETTHDRTVEERTAIKKGLLLFFLFIYRTNLFAERTRRCRDRMITRVGARWRSSSTLYKDAAKHNSWAEETGTLGLAGRQVPSDEGGCGVSICV